MTIAVADTTPLNYLILIDEIDLLRNLFEKILIPQAVYDELSHPDAPAKVRQWLARYPIWLEVWPSPRLTSSLLTRLDPGEREAIQLAVDQGIETVLIDETAGRKVADELRRKTRGTLGILERASKIRLINFRPALSKLEQTKFRMSPALKAAFIARNP